MVNLSSKSTNRSRRATNNIRQKSFHKQNIPFNPFINSYDLDSIALISTLYFKYSCQIIDSNYPLGSGYPKVSGTNQNIYLNEIKANASLKSMDKCFNSTGCLKNPLIYCRFSKTVLDFEKMTLL